jgi:3-hydroxy-9,10-secoandrosta-1,3,5(10)-triene-9,17-dione monooxygenase reductase component
VPLIPGCSARFQCRTAFRYDGGDHIIFVGEVLSYDRSERPPLLYVTGGYALAARKAGAVSTEPEATVPGRAVLGGPAGLPARPRPLPVHGRFPAHAERAPAERSDFFVLSLLSVRDGLSAAEIAEHVAYTGVDIGSVALRSLVDRGLLERSLAPDARYTLSRGRPRLDPARAGGGQVRRRGAD